MSITNNTFLNIMCDPNNTRTQTDSSITQAFQPFTFVNVTGLVFAANTLATDAGCATSQLNYGAPVYSVGTTNAVIQSFMPVYTLCAPLSPQPCACMHPPHSEFSMRWRSHSCCVHPSLHAATIP